MPDYGPMADAFVIFGSNATQTILSCMLAGSAMGQELG
jgi:hypothetical protein